MYQFLKINDKVLILSLNKTSVNFSSLITEVQKIIGNNGNIVVEDVEEFLKSNWNNSSIDVILIDFKTILILNHEALRKSLQVLKPAGLVVLHGSITEENNSETNYISKLRLNGFVTDSSKITSSTIYDDLKTTIFKIVAEKPAYETGSSVRLSFANSSNNLWKFNNQDDLIDESDLLDENDTKKPSELTLQVCSTTGKRKACKDCSCGLSEQLNGKASEQIEKSSCGNCYLGDAFRCASCPYLGMAAFRPGEKIVLDDDQLLNI